MWLSRSRRAPARAGRRRRLGWASALLAVPSLLVVSPLLLGDAQAATTTYYVNSAGALTTLSSCTTDGPADPINPCTLSTALTRANALAGTDPVVIRLATGFAGGTIAKGACTALLNNARMVSALPQAADATSAYLQIRRANTTIDLGNSLGLSDSDCNDVAGLRIDAPGVTVRNVANFYPGTISLWVGPNGDNATLTDLDLRNTANFNPEQAIVVMGGADGVSVTNSRFSGYIGQASGNNGDAMIGLARDSSAPSAAITNLTVSGNSFNGGTNQNGLNCNGGSGAGCNQRGISAGPNTTVNGLSVTNNTFTNFGSTGAAAGALVTRLNAIDFHAYDYTGVALSNLTVTGNTFTGSKPGAGYYSADITLPYTSTMGGTNLIANNTFTAANNQQGSAIYWWGGTAVAESTVNSNLTIRDNTMSGYGFGTAGIVLWRTGAVRVERNTFTNTASTLQTDATSETGTVNILLNNYDTSANRKIPTWFPSATPSVSFNATDGCRLNLTATRPTTDATKLAYPLSLDVYYSPTGSTGAETYLGRANVAASATTAAISVPYPVGQAAGVVRFQTINGATPTESSQYSRTLAVPASNCPVAIISPTSGPTTGNTTVTVTLLGAPAGATLTGVTFGGTAGTSLSGSGTTYTVVTPAKAAGAVNVVLSFSNSTTATLTNAYTYIAPPSLSIVKRAYSDAARTVEIANLAVVDAGQTVYWRYTVTNTGTIALSNIAVTDDRLSPTTVCTIASLAAGANTSCDAAGTVN